MRLHGPKIGAVEIYPTSNRVVAVLNFDLILQGKSAIRRRRVRGLLSSCAFASLVVPPASSLSPITQLQITVSKQASPRNIFIIFRILRIF